MSPAPIPPGQRPVALPWIAHQAGRLRLAPTAAAAACLALVAATVLGLGCNPPRDEFLRLPPDPDDVAAAKAAGRSVLPPAERALADRCSRACVSLTSWGTALGGVGSGTAISPDGKVLTCWSLLDRTTYDEHGKPFRIGNDPALIGEHFQGTYQGTAFGRIRVVRLYPRSDLAIVDIGIPTPDFVSPGDEPPRKDDRVLLLGCSGGRSAASAGRLRAPANPGRGRKMVLNGPAFDEDRGGAVLDVRGNLVGVITAPVADSASAVQARIKRDGASAASGAWKTGAMTLPAGMAEDIRRLVGNTPPTQATGSIDGPDGAGSTPDRG